MDRRFIIIHQSEIVRKGLWAILREVFHHEFILLGAINEISDYSGFSNTELLIFIQEEYCTKSAEVFIEKILNKSNQLHFVTLLVGDPKKDDSFISIQDSSAEIIRKIKQITERKEERSAAMADLSDREKDVLVQVALGLTNKEIADKLFISIHTVISHRKHITEKLGIKSISGLTVYAILNKLIDTENIDLSSLI